MHQTKSVLATGTTAFAADLQRSTDDVREAGMDKSDASCPRCGERAEPGFDVCWKCGMEFGNAAAGPAGAKADPPEEDGS
jgi:ribosomal protein L37AE/L43A